MNILITIYADNLLTDTSFNDENFSVNAKLTFLDLTGNRLERIDSLSRALPLGLEALFLNNNPIMQLCILSPLSCLRRLRAFEIAVSYTIIAL